MVLQKGKQNTRSFNTVERQRREKTVVQLELQRNLVMKPAYGRKRTCHWRNDVLLVNERQAGIQNANILKR